MITKPTPVPSYSCHSFQWRRPGLAISSNTGGVASASKVSMAGTIRGQMIKQNVRSITEPEIKALLAKQQLKVGQGGVVQVPTDTMSAAQM